MHLRRVLLPLALALTLTASEAAELVDPSAYTSTNAAITADDNTLVCKVGAHTPPGEAHIALCKTYIKRVAVRASVQDAPGPKSAIGPFNSAIPLATNVLGLGMLRAQKIIGLGSG
jgi:hypothetical protein